MPEQVKTFHELDPLFGLDADGCFTNNLFYDLDTELHNEGLEDRRLTAKRAEIAQWVYTCVSVLLQSIPLLACVLQLAKAHCRTTQQKIGNLS